MSIEGEIPADFSFNGERASEDELCGLEIAAFGLSEFGVGEVHRQMARVNPATGDAVFFKVHFYEEDEVPTSYASLGVAIGDFENVSVKLTFNPSGELCDTGDADEEDLENSMRVMEEFLAEDLLQGEEKAIVSHMLKAMRGEYTPEKAQALLMARKSGAGADIRSVHEMIRGLVEANTKLATRLCVYQDVLDDYRVISVLSHEIIGDELTDEMYDDLPFEPLRVQYEDREKMLTYLYRMHYDGSRTLDVFNPLDQDESDQVPIEYDEEAGDLVEGLVEKLDDSTPGQEHVRLMTEKLQESSIRYINQSRSLDRDIISDAHTAGATMLLAEIEAAENVSQFLTGLIGNYHETQLFANLKELAGTFGMFEMMSEPEYGPKAANALLGGLLIGLHVAARTLPEEVKEQIDNVEISSICMDDEAEELSVEAYTIPDDTASMAMIYYEAAEEFHPFFHLWEDKLCPEMHFQKYLKRGFGIMLSVMDRASRLYADSLYKEMDNLRSAPEGGIDFEDAFAEIELFLQQQSPES
jgi:hypothetical protein